MGKIKETRQLYKEVLNEISKSAENWTNFLDSSSWNFKYDFDDQILIYAQRPDAKACATMDEWNKKLKRWVNSGTKPIYIFEKSPHSDYPFKLVFDLSDTHNYNNTEYKLWTIKEDYQEDIIDSLEANFGDISSKETLSQAIIQASYNMVVDNIEDYLTSVINHKSNSMLQNISDEEIRGMLITTAWASVSYMMMTRCGINAKEQIQEQEFSYIKYFNTPEVLTILGASVSDIGEMGLREIAKTVSILQKKENLKNRTFAKKENELYSKDNKKIEGGIEDGRENRIHETGRLLHAELNNEEGNNTTREILSNEIQLSEESQEPRVDHISNGTEIDRAFDRDTGTSNEKSREDSGRYEETRGDNGGIESSRPNEMGSLNEQHQVDSRGDSSERIDLQLGNYEKDDSKTGYVVTDDKLNQLLSTTPLLKVSNSEIIKYFENEKDTEKRAAFLKNSFNADYTELIINTDERYGYKAFENGLLSWKGSFLTREAETLTSWKTLTEHYSSMILLKQLKDVTKKLPSVTDQMSLLDNNENQAELEFTQEFIDRVLQERGTYHKYEIYRQFESSLSSSENADYLKRLYGNTYYGSSHTINGSGVGYESSPKGMTLYRGYFKNRIETTLSWSKVANRITELIKADRYLNSKENEEYPNWLKEQELEKELREAEKNFEKQAEQKELELAKKVYSFVKPFEIYNYPDDTRALNTDEDNIKTIQADINDTNNVIDYVNALKNKAEKIEYTETQKQEIQAILSILEKKIPKYEYHLGDTVYIGADEYEIAAISDNDVTLFDRNFPLLNKQMDFKEFERKVRDNYANNHLKVENRNISEIELNKEKLSNIVEQKTKEETQIDSKTFLENIFEKYEIADYGIRTDKSGEIEGVGIGDVYYSHVGALKYLLNVVDEHDEEFYGEDKRKISNALYRARQKEKRELINKEIEYENKVHTVIEIQEETENDDLAVIQNNETKVATVEPLGFIKYLIKEQTTLNTEKETQLNDEILSNLFGTLIADQYIDIDILSDNTKSFDEKMQMLKEKCNEYYNDFGGFNPTDGYVSISDEDINITLYEDDSVHTIVWTEFSRLFIDYAIKEKEKQQKEKTEINEENNGTNVLNDNIEPNFIRTRNKIQDFVLHPEVSINDRNNYKITDNDLGIGTVKEKFARNIEAIKVLKKCEQENRYATLEEQEILSKYVGWGGLQQAFKENENGWIDEYNTLKELLNEEEYKNARASTLTAFYTPPIVINAMYEILQNMGLKEANILEPSCGVGNFFGMLPKELENCKMYGIELDSISGRIAQQLYQKSTIAVNAYEKVELPDSFFDVAIRKCTI